MSITLYGLGQSRSFRCMWALEEAGLEYDFVGLDLSADSDGGAKSPDYLKLHPQGKVPALQHDRFVLTESAAIVNYIDTLCDQSFIPADSMERAKYDELVFFILTELEQPLWTNGKHRFAIPEEHRVPEMLATAVWEFEKALNALGKMTTIDEFALGESFTFADILLAQTLHWADRFKFDVPEHYLAYRDRMYAREGALRATTRLG